jgi:hypothetical protein
MSIRPASYLTTLCALCAFFVAGPACADLLIDQWDQDDLTGTNANPSVVNIDVDGLHTATKSIQNFNATESVGVTVTAGGAGDPNTQLSITAGGDYLSVASAGNGANDWIDRGTGGVPETITFSFDKNVTIKGVEFRQVDWQDQNNYEFVDVLINGTSTFTLLDTNANTAAIAGNHPGTTLIKSVETGSSDAYSLLSWLVSVGNTITFRYGDIGTTGIDNRYQFGDLRLNAIPEPGAFLLGGLVCGVMGAVCAGKRLCRRAAATKS